MLAFAYRIAKRYTNLRMSLNSMKASDAYEITAEEKWRTAMWVYLVSSWYSIYSIWYGFGFFLAISPPFPLYGLNWIPCFYYSLNWAEKCLVFFQQSDKWQTSVSESSCSLFNWASCTKVKNCWIQFIC